jgi:hypothetical protein
MDNRKIPSLDDENQLVPSKVSDWVKKTLLTGVGAVFMTEEGIRNALSEMKLPKNVIAAAVSQADKTKREISGMIASEVRHFLDGIRVDEIIRKALVGQTIEINATIRIKPDKKKRPGNKPPSSK